MGSHTAISAVHMHYHMPSLAPHQNTIPPTLPATLGQTRGSRSAVRALPQVASAQRPTGSMRDYTEQSRVDEWDPMALSHQTAEALSGCLGSIASGA
jgi:hypothetical protein